MNVMQSTGFSPTHFRRQSTMPAISQGRLTSEDDNEDTFAGGDPPLKSAVELLDLSEINLVSPILRSSHVGIVY